MAIPRQDATRDRWTAPRGRRWTKRDGEQMLEALGASGLSAGRFARIHGLTAQRVYWWRSQLSSGARSAVRREAPEFVPVRVTNSTGAVASMASDEGTLEITVGSGTAIRVRRGFDGELLRQVVAALEGAGC